MVDIMTCPKNKMIILFLIFLKVSAAQDAIEVNYDADGGIKYLHVNQTLEIICKSRVEGHPVSTWTYPRDLHDDPRKRIDHGDTETRLVIDKAQASDAGQYMCGFNFASNGSIVSRTIQVVATEGIEVNYDNDNYKLLHVNQTLELICKNKLNRNHPSWRYPRRMYNNPRVKFVIDIGESRMVIDKSQAEDAGLYRCEIEHEYQGKTIYFNKEIQVIVNEIYKIRMEMTDGGVKFQCDMAAYPSPTVIWKIDYNNETLNPPTESPDLDDDNWTPTEPKVVVDKSAGRLTLRPYKGVDNAELFIADVTQYDDGKYFCVATNIAGQVCKSETLLTITARLMR